MGALLLTVVDAEDRVEVRFGCAQQLQAVLNNLLVGPFVRQDAAGLRLIQAYGPQHATLEAFLISDPVALLVDVQGFTGVFAEHPGRAPGFEQTARPRILVRTLVVAGFVASKDQPDNVVRTRCFERLAVRFGDHVVGRRDDQRKVVDGARVVARAAEGSDLGHGVLYSIQTRGERMTRTQRRAR